MASFKIIYTIKKIIMVPKISTLGGYIFEYQKSITNPTGFWSNIAETFFWRKKWVEVLDWDFNKGYVNWFKGAKLNITENIFERHLFFRGNQPAIIWEPNDPSESFKSLSYFELFSEVKRFANVMQKLGITKGDRVTIYLPMVPELTIAILACARIGAIHSVVFAGFSAQALSERLQDSSAKLLITSDGGFRGAKTIPVKQIADEAMSQCRCISKAIILKRTGEQAFMQSGRDMWWHELMADTDDENEAVIMDAEDPLFILYTSGSTGKPKGIVHTTGGYMVYSAYTFKNVFQYGDGDVYFCSADIG